MYLRTKILIAFFHPASLLRDSGGSTCCYFQGLLPQSEGAHMCSLRAGVLSPKLTERSHVLRPRRTHAM